MPTASEFALEFDEPCQRLRKVPKCLARQHDRIPSSADVLGDFQESSPGIFLQIEKEYLALTGDFFAGNWLIRGLERVVHLTFDLGIRDFSSAGFTIRPF